MSDNDAGSLISTRETKEMEIRHKETITTIESCHTPQSQQSIGNTIFLTDKASLSIGGNEGLGTAPGSESPKHDLTPDGRETEAQELRRDSKETQTERVDNQINTECQTEFTKEIQPEISSNNEEKDTSGSKDEEPMVNGSHCADNTTNCEQRIMTNTEESETVPVAVTIDDPTVGNERIIVNKTEEDTGKMSCTENISDLTEEQSIVISASSSTISTTTVVTNCESVSTLSSATSAESQVVCNKENILTDKQFDTENVTYLKNSSDDKKHSELTELTDESSTLHNVAPKEPVARQHTPSRISPAPKTEESKTEEVQVSCRNGFHSTEIKEENLKSQLKEIINEIDIEVRKEEESEDSFYHTWQPKGEYKIEKTHIEYQDIVPVKVPDVEAKETPKEKKEPSKKPQIKPSPAKLEKPRPVERKHSDESNCSTPIEIPEGVPLLARMLPKEGENDGGKDKIPLERLFTPASDLNEIALKKRKLYSSSSFYRPDHPTIEDQVHLAHKISFSLVDDINKQSKGQSMYMKRKSKSTKWVHTGHESGFLEGVWQPEEADLLPPKESREPPPLKLLLNPKGIHDYNSIEDDNYEEYATMSHSQYQISSIGVGKEIVTDLQSPTGKGAALFAKRKKRMDKFIIDETNVQKPLVIKREAVKVAHENSHSSDNAYNHGATPINNLPSLPESRNLPDLSNILTQPKTQTSKSILSTSKGKTIKRSNTVSFPSLDRGFPHRTPNPSSRERRAQIKSWGSQNETGNSLDGVVGCRQQAQKRFSHIEVRSTPKYCSPNRRHLDFSKKQKSNTVYTAEVKVEEKAALSPPVITDFNGIDPSHYLDLAMDTNEKRKSFNLAAKGWGTYNNFYTPLHLGTAS